ncbi:Homeobox protein extradenticle [Hypsibius exemplaris]|uniref:Homeobox protein extradenticle n=1 Tax=Hypsibius exemplaris TaxID=2072580 RepID=A0A1W0WPS1_HYPEX|nr:Homeobox protein extradenticle [Hypsibius exemplaris]
MGGVVGEGESAARGGAAAGSAASQDIADGVLSKLNNLPSQGLDDVHLETRKNKLLSNRLLPALFAVLADIKERTGLSIQNGSEEEVQDPQTARLDNMLMAEGLTGPDRPGMVGVTSPGGSDLAAGSPTDHAEYYTKLAGVREFYQSECRQYNQHRTEFMNHVVTLLREQGNVRPITAKEIDKMVAVVDKKFSVIETHVKQQACEHVMHLRSRFLDARRKRRNFGKGATEILNEYFRSHVSNPYPSEATKEELARQCNITVSQVSNWFGNKRIRFKKNIGKHQDADGHAHSSKKRKD